MSDEVKTLDWESVKDEAGYLFSIWVGNGDMLWAERAWNCIVKQGLADYSNEIEKQTVFIRLITLGTVYHEFHMLAFDEYFDFSTEFNDVVYDKGLINPIRIWQMVGTEFNENYDISDADEKELLLEALEELADRQRGEICRALVNDFGSETDLFGSMYMIRFSKGDGTKYDYFSMTDEELEKYGLFIDEDGDGFDYEYDRAFGYLCLGMPRSPLDSF